MNSFLKGFLSIFNLFPSYKNYDELSDEVDNRMQDLYDRMGWGSYNNPLENSFKMPEEKKFKLDKPTLPFDRFVSLVNQYYETNKNTQRYGQSVMNVLWTIWPEEYRRITGTEYDCFYTENDKTLEKLKESWNDQ